MDITFATEIVPSLQGSYENLGLLLQQFHYFRLSITVNISGVIRVIYEELLPPAAVSVAAAAASAAVVVVVVRT